MTKIRMIFILVGLFAASIAAADPGTGSGTGLKHRPTTTPPVLQSSPPDISNFEHGK